MSRTTDTRSHRKALLLICEGNNTEPIFFDNFKSGENDFVFDISPKQKLSRKDIETSADRGGRRRQRRHLLGGDEEQEDIPIIGPPPKSWIDAAEREFDTYEEIWCVFDKDEHPSCREAFEKAEFLRQQGNNLNIAFSSISIEYYFLLHFEYLYKSFDKSECKVTRKKKANCMLPNAVPGYACQGDRCVNGYARLKGYWTDSKSNENVFYPLLKDKFFVGMQNAELLRRESDEREGDKVFYERNPFTNVDFLIARLLRYLILTEDKPIVTKCDSSYLSISKQEGFITLQNIGDTSIAGKNNLISSALGNPVPPYVSPVIHPEELLQFELPGAKGDIFFVNGTRDRIIVVK